MRPSVPDCKTSASVCPIVNISDAVPLVWLKRETAPKSKDSVPIYTIKEMEAFQPRYYARTWAVKSSIERGDRVTPQFIPPGSGIGNEHLSPSDKFLVVGISGCPLSMRSCHI
jgi:hypothetical protein